MEINNKEILFNEKNYNKIKDALYSNTLNIKRKKYKKLLTEIIDRFPMYDIYSNKIYFINFEDLYHFMFVQHYRLYKHPLLDFKILKYKFMICLYSYCYELGANITACKKPEYTNWIKHINPYYSVQEIASLALTNGIITMKDDGDHDEMIKKLYKKLNTITVSNDVLLEHFQYILDSNQQHIISNYSLFDSYFINNSIRTNSFDNPLINLKIYQLYQLFLNVPALKTDIYLYRFVKDVNFLNNIKINDIYTTDSFISCSRSPPFYSDASFGNILIKFKIPSNIKGCFLMIEGYSLFPLEEEVIISPFCKFKLISKDKDIPYENLKSDNIIDSRYEFDFIEKIPNQLFDQEPKIDLDTIPELPTDFKTYSLFKIKIDNKYELFYSIYYDSSFESSYHKFFANKVKRGLAFYHIRDSKIQNIFEIDSELHVNYFNKFVLLANSLKDDVLLTISEKLAKKFNIKKIIIYPKYKSCIEFNHSVKNDINLYNHDLYIYLIENKVRYNGKIEINKNIYLENYPYLENEYNKKSLSDFYTYVCENYPELTQIIEKKLLKSDIFYEFTQNEVDDINYTRNVRFTF